MSSNLITDLCSSHEKPSSLTFSAGMPLYKGGSECEGCFESLTNPSHNPHMNYHIITRKAYHTTIGVF